ncbi:MAG: hypothetical protein M5R36_15980 [Deltaproteobacteria bacterium]|nr:hypothetical protein [Deltaproteobacteria bacterium]
MFVVVARLKSKGREMMAFWPVKMKNPGSEIGFFDDRKWRTSDGDAPAEDRLGEEQDANDDADQMRLPEAFDRRSGPPERIGIHRLVLPSYATI